MRHLQPKMVEILSRFEIPVDDAEEILGELFLALQVQRGAISQPERWLLASLRIRCARYWRQRRETLCLSIDSGLLSLFSSSEVPEEEKSQVRKRLEQLGSRLSAPCRETLAIRYGLSFEPRGSSVVPQDSPFRSLVDEPLLRCLAALTRRLAIGAPFREALDVP